MSRQAQVERERDARVTLADAEFKIAQKTIEAAHLYDKNPTALKLRQMALLGGTRDRQARHEHRARLHGGWCGATAHGAAARHPPDRNGVPLPGLARSPSCPRDMVELKVSETA